MRTLKPHEYEFDRETYDEQREARRYNPARVIIWGGHRYAISAGAADDVDVFEEGGELYVLSRNSGLNYAGLQVFASGELQAETFADAGPLPEYINGLSSIWAAKRLQNWTDYR